MKRREDLLKPLTIPKVKARLKLIETSSNPLDKSIRIKALYRAALHTVLKKDQLSQELQSLLEYVLTADLMDPDIIR